MHNKKKGKEKKRKEGKRNCEDREVNEQRLFLNPLVNLEVSTTAALGVHLSGC